jgi:hypothetical protein
MQFSDARLPELLDRLAQTRSLLRQLDAREPVAGTTDATDFERLRREHVALQSDLRAELRRRGAY